MGKVVKAIIGVAEIVVGVVTGNFQLIAAGVLTLGSALLAPSSKQQARQAQATTLQLGEVPRQAIFGETLVGGSLLDGFNYGGKYGTDWEVLVLALADHRCEALVGFYVNDIYVPFTGNGAVAGYNGQLTVTWYAGTATQAADPICTAHGAWDANDRLAGICYVVVAYKADDANAKNPVWTAGRPRFAWLMKGKHCYIARKDSSVGGSGPHRWNDPSTWEYTDNLIDCRYNWVRGVYACDRIEQPEQLLVGRGLSAIEAPPENTFWRGNLCDEPIPLASGGTEPRYRVGVLVKADEQFLSTEEMWAAACAGVIRTPEGSVEVDPGAAKSPTFSITDDDLLVGSRVSFSDFRSDADQQWVNTVIPRYIEPAQKWVDHGAPIRRDYADVLADGGVREATLTLSAVTSGTQAQRCGEAARRLGRLVRSGGVTLGPRFAGIEDGDWGIWTSRRHTRGLPMMVRVEAMGLDEKWQNTLGLREIGASVFGWSVGDQIAEGAVASANPIPAVLGAPDAAAWTLAGGALSGADGSIIPELIVTGATEDRYAESILFEYRVVTALTLEDGTPREYENGGIMLSEAEPGPWITDGEVSPGTTTWSIRAVMPKAVYEVAISYRVRGIIGDRLILGPVVAGTLAVARASYWVTSRTVDFPLSSDDTNVFVTAFSGVRDDGLSMDFPAATLAGLASGVKFGVFWNVAMRVYEADPEPAQAHLASPAFVLIGWQETSSGGTYATPPTPPGGWGGSGARGIEMA